MVYFKVDKFSGIAPAISNKLLSDEFGTIAKDIDLTSGKIQGCFNDKKFSPSKNLASSSSRTFYEYESLSGVEYFLEWGEEDVSVVEGPIPGDTLNRLYWTGEDFPRIGWQESILVGGGDQYPKASYALGVPAPTVAPTYSTVAWPDDSAADDSLTPYDIAYQFTLVTADGREGPPSPVSNIAEKREGQHVTITCPTPTFSDGDNQNFGSGALKRIYRSNSGTDISAMQLVDQIPFTSTSYTDTKGADELAEVIPSADWIGPPDNDIGLYPDGPLQGLISLAGGIMAGFTGKRFCLSEAFLPHAWPIKYRITLDENIIAIAGTANGVAALTKGRPYFITGTDPSAMTAVKIDFAQACINKKSVVDMGDYVLYAGPDGLCAVQGASGRVVTEGLLTPEQWLSDYYPSTYKAFLFEGKYIAFFTDGSGFIFDPTADGDTLTTFTKFDTTGEPFVAGLYRPESGELLLLQSQGNELRRFRKDVDNRNPAKWQSKTFVAPKPVSMGWVSIEPQGGVTVSADGRMIFAATLLPSMGNTGTYEQTTIEPSGVPQVTLAEPIMRLPPVVAKEWRIYVEGTNIDSVCIAQSIDEIKSS